MSAYIEPTDAPATPAVRRGAGRRLVRDPLGVVSLTILLVVLAVSLAAPLLGLDDPNYVDLRKSALPPGDGHLLGTDSSGRDILSRLVWGGRVNIAGAALALGVALLVGLPTGLAAGFYGGRLDGFLSWFNNLNMALPGIVVVLAVRAVAGPSVWVAMGVFGVMLAPGIFRIVRAAVQSVRNELYIDAAAVSGLPVLRIIGRHVLTVVRAPVIIQTAKLASVAIAIQSGLEFLGVSDNTRPSWGNMLNEGFRRMASDPLLVLWPSLMIGVVCTALVLLGNALRDALDGAPAAARRSKAPRPSKQSDEHAETERVAANSAGGTISPDVLLSVRDLTVGYGAGPMFKEVVHGVDLDISPGEVLGLVGESGSGKSQTSFAVLDLLPSGGSVTGGSIRFEGRELTTLPRRGRDALRGTAIGYIPQEPMTNLDPAFTIAHQLTMPLRARRGLSRDQARRRALDLLDRVGIVDPEKTLRSHPHEISGGMAQRVLIAGAVSLEPRLLIADEPTTALDVTVQAEVLDLLRDLQRELEMSVLLVTHNFGVVADICDRVAVMQGGRIVETGGTENVLGRPQHEYTRSLLAAMIDDTGPVRPLPFAAETANDHVRSPA